jgi:hypothetical protein
MCPGIPTELTVMATGPTDLAYRFTPIRRDKSLIRAGAIRIERDRNSAIRILSIAKLRGGLLGNFLIGREIREPNLSKSQNASMNS